MQYQHKTSVTSYVFWNYTVIHILNIVGGWCRLEFLYYYAWCIVDVLVDDFCPSQCIKTNLDMFIWEMSLQTNFSFKWSPEMNNANSLQNSRDFKLTVPIAARKNAFCVFQKLKKTIHFQWHNYIQKDIGALFADIERLWGVLRTTTPVFEITSTYATISVDNTESNLQMLLFVLMFDVFQSLLQMIHFNNILFKVINRSRYETACTAIDYIILIIWLWVTALCRTIRSLWQKQGEI